MQGQKVWLPNNETGIVVGLGHMLSAHAHSVYLVKLDKALDTAHGQVSVLPYSRDSLRCKP